MEPLSGVEFGKVKDRTRYIADVNYAGTNDCNWPILLKKSLRDNCSRKGVVDVEIWFAEKAELSWFLRSNTKIDRYLSY